MKKGDTFASYEEYKRALSAYQSSTFQIFTTGNSKKLTPTVFAGYPYKTARSINNCESAVFAQKFQVCAHGGPRRHRGKGVREKTHTRKIDCSVQFKISGSKADGKIRVRSTHNIKEHNHEIPKENYEHERENRLLDDREKDQATELVKNGVPVRQMAAALRIQTKKPIREKDLHNLKARLDRNLNTGPEIR